MRWNLTKFLLLVPLLFHGCVPRLVAPVVPVKSQPVIGRKVPLRAGIYIPEALETFNYDAYGESSASVGGMRYPIGKLIHNSSTDAFAQTFSSVQVVRVLSGNDTTDIVIVPIFENLRYRLQGLLDVEVLMEVSLRISAVDGNGSILWEETITSPTVKKSVGTFSQAKDIGGAAAAAIADVFARAGEHIASSEQIRRYAASRVAGTQVMAATLPETVIQRPSGGQESPGSAKAPEDRLKGRFYALFIAVQDYASPEISSLDNPIKDATLLLDILASRYTFDQQDIIFLKNPDRKKIIQTFNDLRTRLTENDNLFIFYAGHGIWIEDMREGYWLPRDAAGVNDPADWIPNSTIRNYIRALKARHVLLVTDACFSGSIFKVRGIATATRAPIAKIYEMPSRKAITSGSLKEVPDKSAFVEYLAKNLTANAERYLDAQRLYISIREAVINNSPISQTPLYGAMSEAGDEGGDFIFIRR